MLHWNQVPISKRFRDCTGSKVPVQCKSSLRMRDITWPVPPMQNLGTYLNFPPHIAYSMWHFYWAPMKIKGCLLVRPPMLNAKWSENFLSRPKLGKFWRFWGSWGQGFQKVSIFTPKGTCVRLFVNPRRLSHFASKSVEGCDLQVGSGKKTKSHRNSHRKDMSPLTQGLNYRSACDFLFFLITHSQSSSLSSPV